MDLNHNTFQLLISMPKPCKKYGCLNAAQYVRLGNLQLRNSKLYCLFKEGLIPLYAILYNSYRIILPIIKVNLKSIGFGLIVVKISI